MWAAGRTDGWMRTFVWKCLNRNRILALSQSMSPRCMLKGELASSRWRILADVTPVMWSRQTQVNNLLIHTNIMYFCHGAPRKEPPLSDSFPAHVELISTRGNARSSPHLLKRLPRLLRISLLVNANCHSSTSQRLFTLSSGISQVCISSHKICHVGSGLDADITMHKNLEASPWHHLGAPCAAPRGSTVKTAVVLWCLHLSPLLYFYLKSKENIK